MTRLRAGTLAVVLVLACAPPPAETPAPSAVVPVPGGRVVQATFFDAQTLQPFLASDAASLQATSLLYAPLLRPDPRRVSCVRTSETGISWRTDAP